MGPSDNLTIDTPEQIALEFSVAGIGSRLLAIAIDTLVQTALYFVVILALILLLTRTRVGRGAAQAVTGYGGWTMGVAILLMFCIYWGYFAIFETLRKGQTPGKYALKIRVIKDNGRPINVYEAVGRNVMRAIDALPTLYGVGLICMAVTKNNQRLGDLLAGTIVVHERAQTGLRPVWIVEASSTMPEPHTVPQLSGLDIRDLQLIDAFLHRREQLQGFVRLNAADQIIAHVRQKANIGPEPDEGPETFLERMARTLRDQQHLMRSGGAVLAPNKGRDS